jgi:ribosomal protein L37AE/L43A
VIIKCPVCRSSQVGRVGSDQFYCWNCFVEFNFNKGRVNLYEVAEDGSLMAMERSPELI